MDCENYGLMWKMRWLVNDVDGQRRINMITLLGWVIVVILEANKMVIPRVCQVILILSQCIEMAYMSRNRK